MLLINSLNNLKDIDAIATYGCPTSVEYESLIMKIVTKYLRKMKKMMGKTFNMHNFEWVFDKETRNYYYKTMKLNEEYKTHMDKFEYDIEFILDIMDIISNVENKILAWKNPALLLFGSHDTITRKSWNRYSNGYMCNNLVTGKIYRGHHITPCREEPFELNKLQPMIEFFKQQM